MSTKIKPEQLASTINGILNEFKEATYTDIKNAVDKTATETVKNTKKGAPTKTGAYKKGWTKKVTDTSTNHYTATVYNRSKPGLAHLLQNGHGGPHPAPAHPHIQEDDETARIFEENLRKEIQS